MDPEVLKQQRDKFPAALSIQLQNINYPSIVTHDGERVDVRVGHSSVRECVEQSAAKEDGPIETGLVVLFAVF